MTSQTARIEKALTALVLDQPFFAVLAMRLEYSETKDIETFATDGKRLLVNPEFCATLKDDEIVTVLAHEVLHCALGHIWRKPNGAEHDLWNEAADNEANWELENANQSAAVKPFPWPACGKIMEDRFKGWASEKVYRTLSEEKTQQPEGQEGKEGQGQGQGQGQGKSGNGKGKGKGQGQQPQGGNQKQKGFGEMLPVPQDSKEQLKQEWERALVQAVNIGKERGFVPGAAKELVEKITSNKLDWKALLRDFLSTTAKEDWTFKRANNRYEDTDFLMPSLYNERAGHLVFAIDTSGSIDSRLLAEYIAEAQNALDDLEPEKLTLVYCDADVQAVREYQPGDKIELETFGRGGTDFRPVFDLMNKAEDTPKVLVYLTDLCGEFPAQAPEYPTLWVTEYHGQEVPFGEVIEV